MEKLRFYSRLINEAYFSRSENTLKLFLVGGRERTFKDVPEAIVNEMIGASSPGQYYLDHIRKKFKRDLF
jgi:KTSC domain